MWLLHPLPIMNLNWQATPMTMMLRFEKETRFYTICLDQDLFGDWTVVATNGSMRSKIGTSRIFAFEDYNFALTKCRDLAKVRHQHKYNIVRVLSSNIAFMLALLEILQYAPKQSVKKNTQNSKPKTIRKKQTVASNDAQLCFDFG